MLTTSLTALERGVLPVLHGLGDPVSDREGDVGVALWIGLGRAHQGTAPVESASLAAGAVLRDLFLANADRGDNAANDHLVAELARRIRARQGSSDDSLSQPAPSPTPAGGGCRD